MAKKLLNQKEQYIAFTREEAEEVVVEAKENKALIMNKISEKFNAKSGQYFLVDLTYQYDTPKDALEGKKPQSDGPDGQLTIEEVHEGVEVTVDGGGNVSVKTDEVDDLSDIEFKEIPDEKVTEDNIPF